MENIQEPKTIIQQIQESVAAKLLIIGLLTLVLLIPSVWIQSIIEERESRQSEAADEIAEKWSGNQLVQGPVLQLPYKNFSKIIDSKGSVTYKENPTVIYMLPEDLNVVSKVVPEVLHRGIFDAVVYNSKIQIKGQFSALELIKSGINTENIDWSKAKVLIGIGDLKGLKNSPVMKISNKDYTAEPDFAQDNVFQSNNIFENTVAIVTNLTESKSTAIPFSVDLDLKGSGELNFLHLGKNTKVSVSGDWNNPSFTGSYLPEQRNISEKQFSGEWKMSNFNRPFPQQWVGGNVMTPKDINKATFGVKFLLPVDQYQKTMRSAKYAILIILLSFISLFFIELLKKIRVHLLQYVLIGAAMIIYYTLLLSFTEQVGFDYAYLIASVATIVLVSGFISAFLKNKKTGLVFALILFIFYSFIYVIIQLQDLALLFGSVGLFITVASLMYFSVRINRSKDQTAVS